MKPDARLRTKPVRFRSVPEPSKRSSGTIKKVRGKTRIAVKRVNREVAHTGGRRSAGAGKTTKRRNKPREKSANECFQQAIRLLKEVDEEEGKLTFPVYLYVSD